MVMKLCFNYHLIKELHRLTEMTHDNRNIKIHDRSGFAGGPLVRKVYMGLNRNWTLKVC